MGKAQEHLLKEYIAGPTVAELRESGRMDRRWTEQVRAMCAVLYPAGLNIDYYPTNFVPRGETLYLYRLRMQRLYGAMGL